MATTTSSAAAATTMTTAAAVVAAVAAAAAAVKPGSKSRGRISCPGFLFATDAGFGRKRSEIAGSAGFRAAEKFYCDC